MTNVIDYKEFLVNDFKVYVEVNADYTQEGTILPRSLVWEDGKRYAIDKIIDIRAAASLKAGGAGIRYTVKVCHKETFLYLEESRNCSRWFVERKAN